VDQFEKLGIQLHSLVIFRGLLSEPLIKRLIDVLGPADKGTAVLVDSYALFAAEIFADGGNLTDIILALALGSENMYSVKKGMGEEVYGLEEMLKQELLILQQASRITSSQIKKRIVYDGFLPEWRTHESDFRHEYEKRMKHIKTTGYGEFAKHNVFMLKGGGFTPVIMPDPVRLTELKAYEKQRQAVVDNTLALIDGKPAANILLYGDAGTGKSSTVKAVANEYSDKGLRLIELKKSDAGRMPEIIEKLWRNPLKFILFIDDLAFGKEGDDFHELKAALEGSASAKTPNIVIYATSNRRRLMRETFSDRQGDDVHPNETIQETISLSARFGIAIGFFRPDREIYLRIVRELAQQYGVNIDTETLEAEAENFASEGRSPRTARQFIDHLKRTEI
jgi:uncharacterized protein